MEIIKRNGSEATFDIVKIIAAVTKANNVVSEDERLTPMQIRRIAESVENSCLSMNRALSVEEIQDLVENQIMAHGAFEVAKNYITYRYTRTLVRKSNTTDEKILSLIESNNEEVKQENSNKNPTVNAVQRDYMAGEVSKDLTARVLLPQDIVDAHNEGIIHIASFCIEHRLHGDRCFPANQKFSNFYRLRFSSFHLRHALLYNSFLVYHNGKFFSIIIKKLHILNRK